MVDYVYDVNRMIDLAGGDLASKRQAKNRFMVNATTTTASRNTSPAITCPAAWRYSMNGKCTRTPIIWKSRMPRRSSGIRNRSRPACVWSRRRSLGCGASSSGVRDPAADPQTDWSLRGFTFGEQLGRNQSSITIEKTDLSTKGLAQFIFSEFCRLHWSARPFVNVGDDWALEPFRPRGRPIKKPIKGT